MKDLVVVVLAGGSGSRFFPFETDKMLFPFLGKPMSAYTVERIIPNDTNRIVVVANEKNRKYFEEAHFSVPHTVVLQQKPKGMANALLCAKDQIADCQLLILIADDLFDPTLPKQVLDAAHASGAFGVLPGRKVFSYFPGGYLRLKGETITEIVEKPGVGNEPSQWMTLSCQYIAQSSLLLEAIEGEQSQGDDVYERALSHLAASYEFRMVAYEGVFVSLKYPWHVLSVMDVLLSSLEPHKGEQVVMKQNVVIEGNVYIGNNVKIFENTKIVGPVYIGDNTIIGNNNVIRASVIGENCVTGFSTDITRSYIGDNCWFHSNYIGDSVLEGNVSMGSGSVLANLRLDESAILSMVKGQREDTQRNKLGAMLGKHIRIGVNSSLMPGVKVGANSFIAAGITLACDAPPESFVKGQISVVIEKNGKKIMGDRENFKKQLT